MKNSNGAFGRVVKEARIAAKLTREEFSEKIGKSPRYIAALENEGQTPSYETMCTIIQVLGIDPSVIFYPDVPGTSEEFDRVMRLVKQCNEHELSIVAATVEAILSK